MLDEFREGCVVLAHNYQMPEIQDAADFVGDSLGLCQAAQKINKQYILFCGVDFMAESAAMLNPDKTVVVPTYRAKCPMAAMLPADELREAKEEHPDAAVVLYINTWAEARAEADIVCTSANAPEVVSSLEEEEILFGPDKNLAWHVARKCPDKRIIPVPQEGYCRVHAMFKPEHIWKARAEHPDAEVLVHPECTPEVQVLGDAILSTEQMVRHAAGSKTRKFIIATEVGLLHRLGKELKGKEFIPALRTADCATQKLNTWAKFVSALKKRKNVVRLDQRIAERALVPLERMLELSR
ncbi:MAG: quinolinate synthase NadA [Candidatus Hydrothermarchaeaceae archaeon]